METRSPRLYRSRDRDMSNTPLIAERANPEAEATVLARAMTKARNAMVEFYDKHELHDKGTALNKVMGQAEDEKYITALRYADPEQISWYGLQLIASKLGDDVAAEVWHDIKAEALEEFDTGHRAGKVIDQFASLNDRVRFIALRDAFREDWKPRGATELCLVDQLAQIHHLYEKWLTSHLRRIESECFRDWRAKELASERYEWVPPRQSEADATREAADMTDRWQKAFLRTVRALRDLRRFASPVVIQNAGQVNVANQQVNLT